jgi:hypothetical protein
MRHGNKIRPLAIVPGDRRRWPARDFSLRLPPVHDQDGRRPLRAAGRAARSARRQYSPSVDARLRPKNPTPHSVEYQRSDSRCKSRLGRSGDLRRTQRRGMALVTKAEIVSQTGLPTRLRIAGTYTRTDDVELLQDFVSARFAELTAATGLTDWARQVVNAVTSAASSVRSAPAPVASARPGHVFVGYDLPRLSPGIERC